MSVRDPFIKLNAKYCNIYEKIILVVLNSVLIYILSSNLSFIHNYSLEIIAVVAVISFFLPEIISPALTILFTIYLAYKELNLNQLSGMVEIFSLIILNILVPILIEIKYGSMQGFISSEAAISFPISFPLLLTGIAEKRNIIINVLAALPLFFMIFYHLGNTLNITFIMYLSIGIISLIISSILFSIKQVFSITGVIFGFIGLSALIYLTLLPHPIPSNLIYATVIAAAANAIFSGFYEFKTRKQKREKIEEEISLIKKEIESSIVSLGRVRSYAELEDSLSNVIAEDEKRILDISKKIEECKSLDCVNSAYNEFATSKKSIEDKLSQYIFNTVIEYNNVVNELKKNGILLEEIDIPKEKIVLSEDSIDKIQKFLSTINKNISIVISEINSIIDSIEKISGIKLNRFYITEYASVINAIDYLRKNNVLSYANQCLGYDRDILTELEFYGFENKKIEIVKKLNEYYGREVLLSDIKTIERESSQVLILIKEYLNYIETELQKIWEVSKLNDISYEMGFIHELINKLNENDAIFKKLSDILTSIPEISNAEKLIKEKDNIYVLFTILKENEDIIKEKLNEEGCIELEDLGINTKLSTYVIQYLKERNVNVKLDTNKICLS
ncbi:hypothetical protein [Acidianus sp. HS-5]|uniref:hypothetical protein n=1 Tax=Acidianus sp. HS-5 TaxID=2886040 RepID=UPI001F34D88D|nr:hypothetical protein [Acidianus sp. HS-5]BDC19711.1 hypothetical protein HS5_26010 [Acidianus sp. HS-5]